MSTDQEEKKRRRIKISGVVMSVKILGTGSFLPEKSVSNDDLSKVMDTSDEWISSRTGIRSRHISIEDTTSTMAVKAAEKALEECRNQCGRIRSYFRCNIIRRLCNTKYGLSGTERNRSCQCSLYGY